jgi:galactokinase
MALAGANGLHERSEFCQNISGAEDLADYLGCIENGQTFRGLAGDTGVGTFGGSEDHTAMLCSRPGMLSQYSYCPTRLERRIAMPPGHVFAVASSGVAAEKTGDAMEKYNRASRLAAEAAKTWRQATGRGDPHIAAALASADPAAAAARMRGILAAAPGGPFATRELVARFEHFLAESEEIIPAAGDALAAGDLAAFGRLVDRSQHVAETLLGNQVPETCFLARGARDLGAAAASAFGAGFGGSVWALVRRNEAERFLEEWAARYRGAFPLPAARAAFFLSGAGPAAMELG